MTCPPAIAQGARSAQTLAAWKDARKRFIQQSDEASRYLASIFGDDR